MNKTLKVIIKKLFSNLKLKDKIIFESNTDFTDNTRTLFEYLVLNGYDKKYKLIWIVRNPKKYESISNNNVKFYSYCKNDLFSYICGLYHQATAKFLIASNRGLYKFNDSQVYINLWHGTLLKSLKKYSLINNSCDYVSCPSDFYKPIYVKELHVKKEKLICLGSPRNDDLFNSNYEVKKLYNVAEYSKIILWMPTFRIARSGKRVDSNKNFNLGLPIIENIEMLNEFNKILIENKILLVLKPHPEQDLSKIKINAMSNLKILTNDDLEEKEINLYKLIGCYDALITDYSSIYFDYMLLDRPIAFTVDDIEEYKQKNGFAFQDPLKYMPGNHIYNFKEFIAFINQVSDGIDMYKKERNYINELVNEFRDNKNSERITKFLKL